MLNLSGNLKQTVQQAGDSIRQVAQDTGRLTVAALAVAGCALLIGLAALVLVLRTRKVAVA